MPSARVNGVAPGRRHTLQLEEPKAFNAAEPKSSGR